MSLAGQNTVTGISVQADISLLYLLRNFHENTFQEILLESADWEDFTLVFNDSARKSFEVKWYKNALSYSEVKEIISKELKKNRTEDYNFQIVAQKFSPSFKEDLNYLKRNLPYLNLRKRFSKKGIPSVITRLLKKRWNMREIEFLGKIECVELTSHKKIMDEITDLFRYKWEIFLSNTDLNSLVALSFRQIMESAKVGASISKEAFNNVLKEFENNLAQKSETFDPRIPTGAQYENLDKFLQSPASFRQLDQEKYLSPITANGNQGLIAYITKALESNTFKSSDIEFFLDKVLIKQAYIYSCFRLLQIKSKSGLLDQGYFVNFLAKHFKQLRNDFILHDALEILLECLKSCPKLAPQVLKFLISEIFPVTKADNFVRRIDIDYSYTYVYLPKIVEVLGLNLGKNSDFIEILFRAFDFTGDHYQGVVETPSQIYSILKNYLFDDPEKNLELLIRDIANQFEQKYQLKFKGGEFAGGGMGMQGWAFSFTDTGLVRKMLTPFFYEWFQSKPDNAFEFVKRNIVGTKIHVNRLKPAFLFRSLLGPLIQFLSNNMGTELQRLEIQDWIFEILWINTGLPRTEEALFSYLRGCDLTAIGSDFVLDLIIVASIKYEQSGKPNTIFELETLVALADAGSDEALDLLLDFVKDKDFKRSWLAKQFLSLLGDPNLFENKKSIRLNLIEQFDINSYLANGAPTDFVNSDFLKVVFSELLKTDEKRAKKFLKKLLKGDQPPEKTLNLLANMLFFLFQEFPLVFKDIFYSEIRNSSKFHYRYKKSSLFRQNFYQLAIACLKAGDEDTAKHIVSLLCEDSDPNTNANREHNELLKRGDTTRSLTGVRVQVAWTIQSWATKKDLPSLKYALEMTIKLLDLDRRLQNKLKYYDFDYHVQANALVPLIELSKKSARDRLVSASPNGEDEVRALTIKVLQHCTSLDPLFKPVQIVQYLSHILHFIRDLNNAEAELALNLLEKCEFDEAAYLFIYYAVFRKSEFKNLSFNEKPFIERLQRICSSPGPMRSRVSFSLWKVLADSKIPKDKIKILDSFFDEIFIKSVSPDFSYLTYIVEDALKDPNRIDQFCEKLKKCVQREIDHLKASKEKTIYPKIHLGKLAQKLRELRVDVFFSIFELVIENSDKKTGIGVYGSNLYYLIEQFKQLNDLDPKYIHRYEKIRDFLFGIGVILESSGLHPASN